MVKQDLKKWRECQDRARIKSIENQRNKNIKKSKNGTLYIKNIKINKIKKINKNKKEKKKGVGYYKTQLDIIFSQFIRLRDCLKTTGTLTEGICITSDRRFPYKKLQCGHFISRSHNSLRYDERNCHAQSIGDNVFKHGCLDVYFIKMEEMYGRPEVDEMLRIKNDYKKFTVEELKEKIYEYNLKVKNLLNGGN
ncbi:recombination protein NinG [bacterium]|jgi:hypothetical protein|nr:recombination protein NinG [bacterium]